MLYLCPFVVFGSAERQLPKSCEENNLMNKRTLHRLFSVLMALVMAVSLLTGCAQIDESSADELPFPSEETPVEEEHSGLPAVFALPY